METLSLIVITITIYSGLYYQAAAGDSIMESQVVTWIVFFAVLTPSIVFALSFAKKMWYEILKVIAGKSPTAFRFITCGTMDYQEFKKQHIHEHSGDESESDSDSTKAKPTLSQLKGFSFDK